MTSKPEHLSQYEFNDKKRQNHYGLPSSDKSNDDNLMLVPSVQLMSDDPDERAISIERYSKEVEK